MRTLLAASLIILAAPLAAQPHGPSNTHGLFLHLAVGGQGLALDTPGDDLEAEGGGVELRAGYGFSRVFTLYGGVTGARVEGDRLGEADLGAAEIGARFNLNAGEALRPYFDVALRGVALEEDGADLELGGGAVAVGLGAALFLSPTVALDASLHLGGGRFEEVRGGGVAFGLADEVDFGEARVSLGLTAYPFRPHGRDRGRRGRRGGRW